MFGKRLAELRKEKDISQYELAKRLNLSRGQIANYEQGKREPDYNTLLTLANYFDVSIDYLLDRVDDPSPNTSFTIAGQDIELSPEEAKVFLEMRKHPQFNTMFHDLATDPETKVKQLISMWEFIQKQIEKEPEDSGDGFGEFADD